MRFHVVSLPHTHTTSAFSTCAYTEKVRKFCRMMHERGHDVFLYAGEKNEAPCTEHVSCIIERDRRRAVGNRHYTEASFDINLPHWRTFTHNAIMEIARRGQERDFLCLIAGTAHEPIAKALPHLMPVEFGIGYGGSFAKHRVWESYAWMHHCYGFETGKRGANAHACDGTWFDEVIPGYHEPEQFEFSAEKDDYVLFVGRLIERKGIAIAVEACKRAGVRLVTAGPGKPPDGCDHRGEIGAKERSRLMSRARALIAPTIYIEPFGNVAVEAMLCGTPVITTDWGAFTETNVQGVTGYRCRMLRDFVDAIEKVKSLDPHAIRKHAIDHYSLAAVGQRYQEYFERLSTLWNRGWYE